jgi:hypothetical protein
MPRKSLALTLVFLAVSVTAHAVTHGIIPAGTILQCTINEPNFSSKTAMVGDPVLCHLGPLGSFGHSVFPRGAELGGHMQDYKDPGHFVGKGSLGLEFDRLIMPGAEIVPLSTKMVSTPHMKVDRQGEIQGKGHPRRDVVEWMIPVLWPIKVITLPFRGPYPALKGETRISLRLMEDIEVPFPVAQNSIPRPPWASPSSYRGSYDSSRYDGGLPVSVAARDQSVTVRPAAYYPASSQQTVAQLATSPNAATPMTIIALKSGAAIVASQYWLQGGAMRCITASGDQKLPLEQVDLYQTMNLNRERNVEFVLQSRDAVEQ